jgi:hypothetical protein
MRPAAELAAQIAGTEFVPKGLRENPAAIAACVLYGDEVGLGPLQALAKIAVIDGRPALSAEAMRSLIFAAGHDLWVEDASGTKATVAGKRAGSKQTSRVTWTLDDARRANLAGKANWRMYPRQMLLARATAELARLIFADAIGGLPVVEELEAPDLRAVEREPVERPTGELRQREHAPLAQAEPEPAEPADLTEPQRRKLHAAFRERSVDRVERLKWAALMLGRKVESFNDLTLAEASLLIDALEGDDIPFGVPEPSRVAEPEPDPEPSPAPEPDPEPAPIGEEAALSLVMFRARAASAGHDHEAVAAVGHSLFPGRSLADLTDAERQQLFDALTQQAER